MTCRRSWLQAVAAIVVGVLLAGSLVGCGTGGGDSGKLTEKHLRIGLFTEPGTLDFMYEADMAATMTDWYIHDQLARFNYNTGKLEPELAVSWQQETPTSWIAKLRPGVQFQKGYGEMTADDVAFSVNYIIKNNAPIKFLYAGVKNVEVVDKYTVRYNLTAPSTPFVMSSIQGFGGMVLSKKAWEELGKERFARTPVGTGPFYVEEWAAGDHITLRKHDQYWDKGYPKVDKVTIYFVPDPAVKLNMLRAGQLDLVDSVAYKDLDSLKNSSDVVFQTTPGWNWNYISFGDIKGPMGNKKVRQSIGYAIDRKAIAQNVYFGYARPAEKPLPPGFMFENSSITKYPPETDLEKAKTLLAEAGYAKGFELTGIAPEKDDVRRTMQIVAEQLKPLGINLKLQFMDQATYSSISRKPGDFVDFNQITIMSPDPDSAIRWFWEAGGSLTRSYSNPEIDALIEKGKALVTPEERCPVYEELQRKMLDEAWYVYVVHRNLVRAMSGKVKGYEITPQDMDFRWKYVELVP